MSPDLLPARPGGFLYSLGLNPAKNPDVLEALYVSFMTLTALGYGDVVATGSWIRMASPVEALTGFALLTAALTWFTQIYPPLSRRRALALQLKGLADAGSAEAIADVDAVIITRVLDALSMDVERVRVDFTQHTEGFYFLEPDRDLSLAFQLPYTLRLREAALARQDSAVQLSAKRLSSAVEQLGSEIKKDFVGTGEHPREIFAAYAAHGQPPRA